MHISTELTENEQHGKRQIGRTVIDGTLTIYDAAECKLELLAALASVTELDVDLSSVTEIDTAGVQLLVMLKRAATKAGKQMRLMAHSPASVEVIDRYALGGYFGDPVVISSRPGAQKA